MCRFPGAMSLVIGGLGSEVDRTPSLGSKCLMGGLLVLRPSRQGRAVGQARSWCEGTPPTPIPGGVASGKCCFLLPVLRVTGHEDSQMERVGASLLAGKNKALSDP